MAKDPLNHGVEIQNTDFWFKVSDLFIAIDDVFPLFLSRNVNIILIRRLTILSFCNLLFQNSQPYPCYLSDTGARAGINWRHLSLRDMLFPLTEYVAEFANFLRLHAIRTAKFVRLRLFWYTALFIFGLHDILFWYIALFLASIVSQFCAHHCLLFGLFLLNFYISLTTLFNFN